MRKFYVMATCAILILCLSSCGLSISANGKTGSESLHTDAVEDPSSAAVYVKPVEIFREISSQNLSSGQNAGNTDTGPAAGQTVINAATAPAANQSSINAATAQDPAGTETHILYAYPPYENGQEQTDEHTPFLSAAGLENVYLSPIEVKPQCTPSYGFSFGLPDGWSYEITQTEDEPTGCVSARLKPENADAGQEGWIVIEYSGFFGVCGTGLEEKEIDFNGYEALQGFYDGNPVWSFIALKGDYRGCVILNHASNIWADNADMINRILSTVRFHYYGEEEPAEQSMPETLPGNTASGSFSFQDVRNSITPDTPGVKTTDFVNTETAEVIDAAERAKSEIKISYDSIQTFYDSEADIWAVHFSTSNTAGGDATVYLDDQGITKLVVYGE